MREFETFSLIRTKRVCSLQKIGPTTPKYLPNIFIKYPNISTSFSNMSNLSLIYTLGSDMENTKEEIQLLKEDIEGFWQGMGLWIGSWKCIEFHSFYKFKIGSFSWVHPLVQEDSSNKLIFALPLPT